jgi:hypothetical protein
MMAETPQTTRLEDGGACRPRLVDLVESVRAIPYGRPRSRTVEGMLREQRGTCSTKHLYLVKILADLEDRHCDPGVREPLITALSKVAMLRSPSP